MCRTLITLVLVLLSVQSLLAQDALKLPAKWKLPAMDETAKVKLLDVPGNPGDPLSLAIRSEAADLPKAAVIVAEPAPDRKSWLVMAVDDPGSKTPRTVNLATITREWQSLYLAWSQPLATPVLRRQVMNCQLDLRVGAISDTNAIRGTVQLREPVTRSELVLDLKQERQSVEFELTDLPRQRDLRLEIRGFSGFKTGTKVREGSKSVGVGKRATIDVADLPGAEIRIIMQPLPAGGGLAVIAKSVFREKGAEFDLTLPGLENLVSAAEQSRREAERALPDAKDVASDLQDDLERLQRNRPSNITEVYAWERSVSALTPQIRAANKRVQALNTLIAECEVRLKAAPKVKDVLKSLDSQAAFSFAICAETSSQTNILLAESSGF